MISVTVYSTGDGCPRCVRTCACLRLAGIPFTIIDLSAYANAPAREFVTDDLGYTAAPVVVVDQDQQHHWSGFRPDLIQQLSGQIEASS
ncbi:glutaredoxin family protein [Microbacterium lacticum]|uniref:Glutaredoxin-like protein NrdH n=2 Tax=Microbacterium lacticum TaxID=33885 RepID=A0A543KT51_9MICO|nr:glutaredoxin family protein [Microbacterium lacticum]TQM98257.1 glutaredoxin-like protein NrdH [Microbacterium lacticum]